ncbi:MAG: noncanonical pyrimidine nucleotidase, YjjG family [Clostridiales bacterium]|jgi:2-haloacid dehalogenase|nr:noncanonical pyrimidine nucleotidase, YjjG family [Clostridiales bacterium]
MIKAVLIDVDNTLLDFNECAKESMKKVFEDFELTYKEELFEVFKSINDDLWEQLEKGQITKEELRDTRWNLIFKQCGISEDGVRFEKKFEERLAESHQTIDGALELLQYLSSEYDVYIATNGFVNAQVNRISLAGMMPYIKRMFISEAIGYAKPSGEFFEYCLSEIGGIKKDEVIIIGDSLSADIIGGTKFGIRTCWFNRNGGKAPDGIRIDHVVRNLNEITDIL